LSACSVAPRLGAAEAIWTNSAAGSWTNDLFWSPNLAPNGVDAVAKFTALDVTGAFVVTLDGNKTLGALYIDDTNAANNAAANAYTFRTANPVTSTLTFQVSSGVPII